MKFPKFMKPKTLFSGLSVAGAIGLFAIANGSQVSADTITWQQSTDAWSEGMMHFERDGRESRSKYVVLRLNDRVVFCLDPWTPVVEDADYDYNESKYTKDVTNLGEANVPIDEATFRRLELIAYYGYYGSADKRDWRAVMTQALIWNEMGYTPKQFTGDLTMTDFENFKAEVMEKVNNHQAFTSWNGSSHQIQKGQTIELTDENNVIQKLSIPSTQDGYTFSLNGNVLSITATQEAPAESKTFTFTSADTSYEGASLVWFKSGSQTVGEFKIKDGNIGSVSLSILPTPPTPPTPPVTPPVADANEAEGAFYLRKTNTDKEGLAGVEFEVFQIQKDGSEKSIGKFKTDKDGLLTVEGLEAGKYYIREVKAADGYKLSDKKIDFNIVAGQKASAATATLFQNERVPVIKTDATNAQTGTKAVYKFETKKEVAHLTNLDIGKTYVVRTYENDRDTGKQRLQVQEKKIVATAHEMEVEFEYPVLEETIGHWSVFGEELLDEQGNILASNFDWNNDRETVYNRNPKLNTIAQVNGKKVTTVGEDGKVSDTIKYQDFEKGSQVFVRLEITKYGTDEVVGTYETTATIDESGELVVNAETLNTKDLPAGKYVLFETVFEMKDGKRTENVISKERDNKNEDQSFEVVKPNEVVKSNKVVKPKSELPKTNTAITGGIVVAGVLALGAAGYFVFKKRNHKAQ
jgi:cell wall-associated surface protein